MPPKKSAQKLPQSPARIPLLPVWVGRILMRFVPDAVAGTLAAVALFLAVALITYNSGDPSWSVATEPDAKVTNLAGPAGAIMSDIMLQTFGAGSAILILIFFMWAGRIVLRHPMAPWSGRIIAALLCFCLTIAALAPASSSFGPYPFLGGVGGSLLFDAICALFPQVSLILITIFLGLLALFACILACGISRAELWSLWSALRQAPRLFMNKKRTTPRSRVTPKLATKESQTQKTPTNPSKTIKRPIEAQGDFILPDIDLLTEPTSKVKGAMPDQVQLRESAAALQTVLADFNIEGDIVGIHPGPVVTLYELEPAPGTKSSRVISLADDIARSMSMISVRCAVVPGRNVIGIELPNTVRQTVYMHEMVAMNLSERSGARLPLILGKDISGKPIVADLAKMPHLLVAGTTGSGKSVAINTMILSLLFCQTPEKCRFIMIDPKMLELSVYDDIPHLLTPVVTEPSRAITALKWAVAEMEQRYRAMSRLGVRNIEGYNARLKTAREKGETLMHKVQTGFDPDSGAPVVEEAAIDLTDLPYIVIIVDEFADLMLVAGKDVENAIQRLAQMARAAGLHLIMATQRPSVDVITGVIKANFPTRISFAVTSKIDSRTILGEGGAEQLLGLGDMLYMAPGGRLTRVHGPFVSDDDVESVARFLRDQGPPSYMDSITDGDGDFGGSEVLGALFGGGDKEESIDELYDKAVAVVAREGKASTSFVQRHLQIGYNRAARIIEEMERQGVISRPNATGKREVLVGSV